MRSGCRIACLLIAVLATAIAGSSCDVPSDLPNWSTRWTVPVDSTRMTVSELLPDSLGMSNDDRAFQVRFRSLAVARSLASVCEPCAPLNGLEVPKPDFRFTYQDSIAFPPKIIAVDIESALFSVRITNNLGFDPIRPGPHENGSLEVSVYSGGTLLGRRTISGDQSSFAPMSTLEIALPLESAVARDQLEVRIDLDSPEGDPILIDLTQTLAILVDPGTTRASRVEIVVEDQSVSWDEVDLDLLDVDETTTNHLKEAAFIFETANPFAIAGNFTLRLQGEQTEINKPFALPPGEATIRIGVNEEEIHTIFGHQNRLMIGGIVTATAPDRIVEVRPTDAIGVKSSVDATIRMSGE